jgi:hypothetical protein
MSAQSLQADDATMCVATCVCAHCKDAGAAVLQPPQLPMLRRHTPVLLDATVQPIVGVPPNVHGVDPGFAGELCSGCRGHWCRGRWCVGHWEWILGMGLHGSGLHVQTCLSLMLAEGKHDIGILQTCQAPERQRSNLAGTRWVTTQVMSNQKIVPLHAPQTILMYPSGDPANVSGT